MINGNEGVNGRKIKLDVESENNNNNNNNNTIIPIIIEVTGIVTKS
jgi:hypothetical protein